jgi:succinate-acetate transporter protein
MSDPLNQALNRTSIVVANPSTMGLFGLAMVTLVASTQKLGWTSGTALVLPWAIFLGALLQLYASILDAKLNNVFGATAFGAYAFFWLAVAMTWMISGGWFGPELADKADLRQLGVAFLGYLLFSLFMTLGAMATTKVLFAIFVLIDFLFLGLGLSVLGVAKEFFHALAGWSELAIALLSFYAAAAAILNHQFGRTMLPLGKAFGPKRS